jgi:uncharacterized RDD family membrane protein YckC
MRNAELKILHSAFAIRTLALPPALRHDAFMSLTCPKCARVLEYSGDAPSFCSYCGQALAQSSEVATAEFMPTSESAAEAVTLPPDPQRTRPVIPLCSTPVRPVAGYRLVRELGRGGMGVVWEAEQLNSGRRVALKLLVPGQEHTLDSLERFLREGRLAAALSHPRSTFVFEAGADDGRPYISMELMPGRTLADIGRESGPLPVSQAVDHMLDVIEGLDAAHAAGVIHRDVKPSNCFFDSDGRIKVGDFGLSKSLLGDAALTRTGAFMGTPLFAAPEQVRGGAVDERTDIYGVGATLFFLIAGRGPFEGDATAVIAQIASDPAPSLQRFCPGVPKDLDRIVARALEKEPGRRFGTLADFRQALLPFASQGLTPAPLGRRLGAFFLDLMIAGFLCGLAIVAVFFAAAFRSAPANRIEWFSTYWMVVSQLISFVGMVSYFTLLEARGGRSLGKRVLGLRVVRADGSRPGLWRAFVRAVLVPGLIVLGELALLPLLYSENPANPGAMDRNQMLRQQLLGPLAFVPVGLCLASMRRRNGFRGLHELATGTRVVTLRAVPSSASDLDVPVIKPQSFADLPSRFGPYEVRGLLGRCGDATVYAGRDESLDRRVWIFARAAEAPPISTERALVSRPARPRWLQGGVCPEGRWDAFEAVRGSPLRDLGRVKWEQLRFVLRELAQEFSIALNEGTLPARLTRDQVWLDRDGQTRLLDAPILGIKELDDPLQEPDGPTAATAVALLRDLAQRCSHEAGLPIHAREFIAELQRRPDDAATLAWAADQLNQLASRAARVYHSDRFVSICVSAGLESSLFQIAISLVAIALSRVTGLPMAGLIVMSFLAALLTPAVLGYFTHGGPVFRLVSIAVRRNDGRPATRLRCAVRTGVAWVLAMLNTAMTIAVLPIFTSVDSMGLPAAGEEHAAVPADALWGLMLAGCASGLLYIFHILGAIYAIVQPERGLQDLIAGTRLVPR